MNRREAVGALVLVTVACVAGFIDRNTTDWGQQLDTARVELESATTGLHSAAVTGQPIRQLQQQCQIAVATYNQAAAHLNIAQLNPSTECSP